jgi:type IV pilus assembly protein PilP
MGDGSLAALRLPGAVGVWAAACLAAAGILVGCGSDAKPTATKSGTDVPPPPLRGPAIAPLDAGTTAAAEPFTEADFVENDRNRDPFRSFASQFVDQKRGPVRTQLQALLSQYALEELKLVAIVLAGDYPRAMLRDPTGRGWVIKKGDYLGRAEVVRAGGQNGTEYMVHWRVDRIRDGDVVFVREDPGQPNMAPATRVLPLRNEADKDAKLLQD